MRYATANIQALPPMAERAVIGDVRKVAQNADVIGFQEIRPQNYKEAIQRIPGFAVSGLDTSTPIAWRTRHWAHVQHGHIILHKPVEGITHIKHMTWVHLRRVGSARDRGKEIIVTNRHYVNKIFASDTRRNMWLDANRRDRDRVAGFVRQGYPIVGLGDYNRSDHEVMGSSIERAIVHYGYREDIDYVWFIDGFNYHWDLDEGYPILLHSDHDAHVVRAQLDRKRT